MDIASCSRMEGKGSIRLEDKLEVSKKMKMITLQDTILYICIAERASMIAVVLAFRFRDANGGNKSKAYKFVGQYPEPDPCPNLTVGDKGLIVRISRISIVECYLGE